MALDPVCRMQGAESQAKYRSVHGGRKYYFRSAAFKQEFEKNSSKYAYCVVLGVAAGIFLETGGGSTRE